MYPGIKGVSVRIQMTRRSEPSRNETDGGSVGNFKWLKLEFHAAISLKWLAKNSAMARVKL
jgi:hypothetical protein